MGEVLGLARPISMSGIISTTHNKSLDASGGSVFRNQLGAAKGALNRAAASTQTLGSIASFEHLMKNLVRFLTLIIMTVTLFVTVEAQDE